MSEEPDVPPAVDDPEDVSDPAAVPVAPSETVPRGTGDPPRPSDEHDDDEEQPRIEITRKRALLFLLFVAVVVAFLYVVLPQLGDVKKTYSRLDEGDPWWLGIAVAMQVAATASYVAVFKGVHVPPGYPIRFKESYLITMAGLAATRLFAAGGAGGVALTAWALRRSGMPRSEVAERMIAFLVLTYGVYMSAIVVCGFGLRWGILPGANPFGVTIIPAWIAVISIVLFLGIAFLPADLERRIGSFQPKSTRLGRVLAAIASGPARLGDGTRFAIYLVRHPDWALLGTLGWWTFNIGVLYASFDAFGDAPPIAVVVQAFFVGMLANLLPLPGGVGGVDAGMIGVFAAFDVDSGLAVISVLCYRLLAFWLPSIPGGIAYFQLRHTVAKWGEDRKMTGATIQNEVKT